MTRDRLLAMIEGEQFLLDALTEAYQSGAVHYAHFSPGWDVTAVRFSALQLALEAMDAALTKGIPND